MRRIGITKALALALTIVVVGCSSESKASGTADARIEYSVKGGCAESQYTVHSGNLKIDAVNIGTDSGELEILQGAKALAEKEDMLPDSTERINVSLAPGTYTLICGKLNGKKAKLVVEGDEESMHSAHAAVRVSSTCVDIEDAETDSAATVVTVNEWTVSSPPSARAGHINLVVRNAGALAHELVIAKGSVSGLEIGDEPVDEAVLGKSTLIGELEGLQPGTECNGEFKLAKGDYVLFCNLVNEKGEKLPDGSTSPKRYVHAAEGMAADFTVTG